MMNLDGNAPLSDKQEKTRLGYIDKEQDMESSLADHGVRKYDYETGRFISCDALWGKISEWSPYQYGYNNPVIMKDNNGEWNIIVHDNLNNQCLGVLKKYGYSQKDSENISKGGHWLEFTGHPDDQAFHHLVDERRFKQYGYDQAKEICMNEYNEWKTFYYDKFVETGDFEYLGKYLHMVQDAFSDAHKNWQVYTGTSAEHLYGDFSGDYWVARIVTRIETEQALKDREAYIEKNQKWSE